jgi:hypothetical protein
MPLMAIGILLFLLAPIQEHREAASGVSNLQANPWGRPAWQIVAEEGTGLLATFCFLSAGLRFAEYRSRGSRRVDGKVGLEIGWRFPVAMFGVYALGIGAVYLVGPDIAGAAADTGVPLNWFPATTALLGCLLALHLSAAERNRIGSPPGSRLALQVLAAVNLALSVGYAANSPMYHLLDSRMALQSGWGFATGAGVLLSGMFAARISGSRLASAGLLIWSLSFLVRPVLDSGNWAALGFLGQVALLSALGALLTERVRQTWVVGDAGLRLVSTTIPPRRKTA